MVLHPRRLYVTFFSVAGAAPALMELSMILSCAFRSRTAASARFGHGVFGPKDIGVMEIMKA